MEFDLIIEVCHVLNWLHIGSSLFAEYCADFLLHRARNHVYVLVT